MATVVSAFYIINSKFPSQLYLHWIKNFFELPCNLVFFTTPELIDLLKELRGVHNNKTVFITLPIENWIAFTKYGDIWQKETLKDKEQNHSPELYAIWYEKKEFVKRTIQLNPFNHEKFVWCDAGAFRDSSEMNKLLRFPQTINIPNDKMLLLEICPFIEDEIKLIKENSIYDFCLKNRIGGGIQAGTAAVWEIWSNLYDIQLEKYLEGGLFVGKDQNIMASIVILYPSLVSIIKHNMLNIGVKDIWFTLLYYLS